MSAKYEQQLMEIINKMAASIVPITAYKITCSKCKRQDVKVSQNEEMAAAAFIGAYWDLKEDKVLCPACAHPIATSLDR